MHRISEDRRTKLRWLNLIVAELQKPPITNPLSFFFYLGDIGCYHGEEEYYYDQFYKPFEEYAPQVFAILGYHDRLTYNNKMISLGPFKNALCADKPEIWSGSGGIQGASTTQLGICFTLDTPLVFNCRAVKQLF